MGNSKVFSRQKLNTIHADHNIHSFFRTKTLITHSIQSGATEGEKDEAPALLDAADLCCVKRCCCFFDAAAADQRALRSVWVKEHKQCTMNLERCAEGCTGMCVCRLLKEAAGVDYWAEKCVLLLLERDHGDNGEDEEEEENKNTFVQRANDSYFLLFPEPNLTKMEAWLFVYDATCGDPLLRVELRLGTLLPLSLTSSNQRRHFNVR
jgi:hypothetical protein